MKLPADFALGHLPLGHGIIESRRRASGRQTPVGRGCRSKESFLLDDGDDLTRGHRVAGLDPEVDDCASSRRADLVLHLHRFEHAYRVAAHRRPGSDMDLDDCALHWRGDHAIGRGDGPGQLELGGRSPADAAINGSGAQ